MSTTAVSPTGLTPDFDQRLRTGQNGEALIAEWLQSRGHSTIQICSTTPDGDKAPALLANTGDLIVPDVIGILRGKPIWYECKVKTIFSLHRITNCWTTGIDIKHYHHYQQVQQTTGWPLWILLLHTDDTDGSPTGLYGQSITHLVQHEHHRSDRHGNSGMVYWAEHSLRKLAELDELLTEK